MKKKLLKLFSSRIFIVLLAMILIILSFFAAIYVFLRIHERAYPMVPPSVTYGEFPFCITYEVNGKTKVYKDVLICEFDGYQPRRLGATPEWKWKTRLKSGKDKKIVLLHDETETFSCDVYYPNISLYPEYFMGDLKTDRTKEDMANLIYNPSWLGYRQWENGELTKPYLSKEEALEKFHIRIMNVECAPPIENSYAIDKEK